MSPSDSRAERLDGPAGKKSGYSAAHVAYSILEIRREIFRYLSTSSLAAFLRVEKACMGDVARLLYHIVDYFVADSYLTIDSSRSPIYTAAVTEVDARSMTIHPRLADTSGWVLPNEDCLVYKYDPEIFDLIVPYLRHRFPSLRTIRFGSSDEHYWMYPESNTDVWTLTLDPDVHGTVSPESTPMYDQNGYMGDLGGNLTFLLNRKTSLWLNAGQIPTDVLRFPSPPRGSYDVTCRFNLHLHNDDDDDLPEHAQSWVSALRDAPGFGNIHIRIKLELLPISLGDLTHIYQRQIDAGHVERLSEITVTDLGPFDVDTFATFANIASTSLTSLSLLGWKGRCRPTTTFAALPQIIAIVRADLPNLSKLALGLDEIEGAEVLCGTLLTRESLGEGGTISDLQIQAGRWPNRHMYDEEVEVEAVVLKHTPLFNIIRVLSALCTSSAKISVTGAFKSCDPTHQNTYLHYLRR